MAGCGTEPTTPLDGHGLLAGTCDTENGVKALHWAPGDACIPVTYEPELEPYRGEIERGLEAWSKLDCSRLCFKEPVQERRDPSQLVLGAIHLTSKTGEGIPIVTELTFEQDSLEILGAVLDLDVEALTDLSPDQRSGAWAGAVGRAVGLDHAEEGVRSVLARLDRDLTPEPSPADEAAFCGVYGPGGVCALTP